MFASNEHVNASSQTYLQIHRFRKSQFLENKFFFLIPCLHFYIPMSTSFCNIGKFVPLIELNTEAIHAPGN